jgi:hypothetical protein
MAQLCAATQNRLARAFLCTTRYDAPMPRRFQFCLAAAIAVALLAVALWSCYFLYTVERNLFRSAIHVGMTRDEVKAAVGNPCENLATGARLPAWGSTPARSVDAETWVYFVVPKSQHRFVLTFDEDRVAKIEYGGN